MTELKTLVCAFAREMNLWEQEFHGEWLEVLGRNVHDAPAHTTAANQAANENVQAKFQARYETVFQRYCTQRKRAYGGPSAPRSAGVPTRYQGVDEASFVSADVTTAARAEVVCQTAGQPLDYRFMFVLVKKGGHWLIDGYKRQRAGATKWEPGIL